MLQSLLYFQLKEINLQNNGFKNVSLIIRPNKAKRLKDK